jgi:hypothetical protein
MEKEPQGCQLAATFLFCSGSCERASSEEAYRKEDRLAAVFQSAADYDQAGTFRFLRRPSRPNATSPVRKSGSAPGSGIGETPGTPATFTPEVVPNENVAPVINVAAVMPAREISNVAVWLRNGLCGPLPAIEPLALVNMPAGPDGPIIRCAGPAAPPASTSRWSVDPVALRTQPVGTVAPVAAVPFAFTVISWAELELSEAPEAERPPPKVKNRSLTNCPADVGLASKSDSTTCIEFVPVVNAAEALTEPSVTLLPVGVTKVAVAALTGEPVSTESDIAAALIAPVMNQGFFCILGSAFFQSPPKRQLLNRRAMAQFLSLCILDALIFGPKHVLSLSHMRQFP